MAGNEVILITGASTGIGKELARCFANDQLDLVLTARNKDRLESLAEELRNSHNIDVYVCACDLASPNGTEQLIDFINTHHLKVHILVNNAGFGISGAFKDTPWDDVHGMMQLNMITLVDLTYKCLPHMLQQNSGGILNVASTAAFQPGPNFAVYCATKSFVLSFTEALHEELHQTGIKVTALCPGATLTEFQKRSNMEKSLLFNRSLIPLVPVESVAKQGYNALKQGKVFVVTGKMNKLSTFLVRLVPRVLVRKIAARLMQHT